MARRDVSKWTEVILSVDEKLRMKSPVFVFVLIVWQIANKIERERRKEQQQTDKLEENKKEERTREKEMKRASEKRNAKKIKNRTKSQDCIHKFNTHSWCNVWWIKV